MRTCRTRPDCRSPRQVSSYLASGAAAAAAGWGNVPPYAGYPQSAPLALPLFPGAGGFLADGATPLGMPSWPISSAHALAAAAAAAAARSPFPPFPLPFAVFDGTARLFPAQTAAAYADASLVAAAVKTEAERADETDAEARRLLWNRPFPDGVLRSRSSDSAAVERNVRRRTGGDV
jgi:hypothetical protein